MVKEKKTRKGPIPRPEETRTERLTLRVHPDLMSILTERARERGVSRSQYIEKLLIGWSNGDPRNTKVDSIGKFVPDAQDPAALRTQNPLAFAQRWERFATAHTLLLGSPPPQQWFEEIGSSPDNPDYPPPPGFPGRRR